MNYTVTGPVKATGPVRARGTSPYGPVPEQVSNGPVETGPVLAHKYLKIKEFLQGSSTRFNFLFYAIFEKQILTGP